MEQPEALRLAELIRSRYSNDINDDAAAELRRQHALIAELVAALMAIYDRHNSATMAQARAALSKAMEK